MSGISACFVSLIFCSGVCTLYNMLLRIIRRNLRYNLITSDYSIELGRVQNVVSFRPKTVFLSNISVMLKNLSSEYHVYACGKIFQLYPCIICCKLPIYLIRRLI